MSADWIEGDFEGVYSGVRSLRRSARPQRKEKKRAHLEPRRFGFEIQSGKVSDLRACDERDPGAMDGDRVIRQSRVKCVRLASEDGQAPDCETSLFDVHISDWQLKYPAESGERAYGTIVGKIRARRRPSVEAPSDPSVPRPTSPAQKTTEPPEGSAGDESVEATQVPNHSRALRAERVGRGNPSTTVSRIGWTIVLVLVAVVFAAIAQMWGLRSALIWLAPIATGLLLLRLKPGGILRRARWWLKGLLVSVALFVVGAMLVSALQHGCWPTLGIDRLALLGGPVVLAALFGSRGTFWITGSIWTLVLCAGGASPEASTCEVAAIDGATAAIEAPTPEASGSSRTDARGRWPVMPPLSRPGLGPDAGGASKSSANHDPSSPSPSPSLLGVPSPTSAGDGLARPDSSPAASGTTAPETPNAPQATTASPDANPSATAGPAISGERRLAEVDGGWVSPDHRRTARESVLISIEQANRTPALFFDGAGARRVYLPTDPIFEEGTAVLSEKAPLVLARVAALLSLPSKSRVQLEVHSDSAGAPESQLELCRQRAAGIRGWLIDRGHISPSRFEMIAVGGGRPLVPPDGNYAAQQPNRRIEIRLVAGN